jgi:hypothetical protein
MFTDRQILRQNSLRCCAELHVWVTFWEGLNYLTDPVELIGKTNHQQIFGPSRNRHINNTKPLHIRGTVCMYDDKPLVLHLVTYMPPYLANDTITTITKFIKLPINKSQRVSTIIQHYDF